MRSIKNIKERVTDFGNLRDAYFHARRNKRFRNEVLEFSANLEDNLHDLQKALRDQTYVPGPYKKKVIHDPVDRLIMWQAFIHRVVQWAVYQVINPEFVRGYIISIHAPHTGGDLVITANKKYTKKTTLQELDVEIAALKVYVRLAADLQYLPLKKYEVWSKKLVAIGKMVGGWIRSQREALEPQKENAEQFHCADCGEEIPAKAHKYSVEHFGRPLCYKCQKRQRK